MCQKVLHYNVVAQRDVHAQKSEFCTASQSGVVWLDVCSALCIKAPRCVQGSSGETKMPTLSCVCFENELKVFAKTVIKEANASLAKGVPMKELALEKI